MTTVTTPYPGTFYRRPRPDAEPYVSEGQRISAGQAIGLVEVMKNFFEVVSDADGVVERFLVDDQDLVDAGQGILTLVGERS